MSNFHGWALQKAPGERANTTSDQPADQIV